VSLELESLEAGLWLWMLLWKPEARSLKLGGATGSSSLRADLLIGVGDCRNRSTTNVTSFDTEAD